MGRCTRAHSHEQMGTVQGQKKKTITHFLNMASLEDKCSQTCCLINISHLHYGQKPIWKCASENCVPGCSNEQFLPIHVSNGTDCSELLWNLERSWGQLLVSVPLSLYDFLLLPIKKDTYIHTHVSYYPYKDIQLTYWLMWLINTMSASKSNHNHYFSNSSFNFSFNLKKNKPFPCEDHENGITSIKVPTVLALWGHLNDSY